MQPVHAIQVEERAGSNWLKGTLLFMAETGPVNWVQEYTQDWLESKIIVLASNALYLLHGLEEFLAIPSLPFP